MNKLVLGLVVLGAFGSLTCRGAVSRGGFGVLFPDQNSTRNVGELARSSAFAVQASGSKFTGTHEMALALSVAGSASGFALAAYGCQYGMDPLDSAQSNDIFGAAIGYAPSSFAFAVAAEKEHDIHTTIARSVVGAVLRANMSYVGKGPLAFGVGLQTSLDRPTGQQQQMEFALGVKGQSTALETVQTISTESGNWTSGLFGKWEGQAFYAAAGGKYLGRVSALQFLVRAGIVWRGIDVSAFASQIVADNENPFSGASLRVAL